jgi:hypothetical protein
MCLARKKYQNDISYLARLDQTSSSKKERSNTALLSRKIGCVSLRMSQRLNRSQKHA